MAARDDTQDVVSLWRLQAAYADIVSRRAWAELDTVFLPDTTVEIDQGLVSRTTQNIPLRRVQDVTVSSTVFQRVLGFGDIVIDNASETGGKVVLKNINSPRKYADLLLRQIRLLER